MPWIASQVVDLQVNCSTHEVQRQKNSCHRKCCGFVVRSLSCHWQNEDFGDHDRQPVGCQQPDTSVSNQTKTYAQDKCISKSDLAVRNRNHHTATGNHMKYMIPRVLSCHLCSEIVRFLAFFLADCYKLTLQRSAIVILCRLQRECIVTERLKLGSLYLRRKVSQRSAVTATLLANWNV